MNLIRWIKSLLTSRGKALATYRSGIKKANKGNYEGAVADYSAVILASETPTDVKAMALYNRSLAYTALKEEEKATKDLASMLEMPGLPDNIKAKAHLRRERMRRRDSQTDNP